MVRNDGCGSCRWNVTSSGPFVVISRMLNHQALRGFFRILLSTLPVTMSQVHFTSALVNGLPSCHFTPSCRRNVSDRSSAPQVQDVPSSGMIRSPRFCGLSGSNITRLLKTAMNGISVEAVASSQIDALGGLSRCAMRSTPPGFCACAPEPTLIAATRQATASRFSKAGMPASSRLYLYGGHVIRAPPALQPARINRASGRLAFR